MGNRDMSAPKCCEMCGQQIPADGPSPDRDQTETIRLLGAWMSDDKTACAAVLMRVFDPSLTLKCIGQRLGITDAGVHKALERAARRYPALRLRVKTGADTPRGNDFFDSEN